MTAPHAQVSAVQLSTVAVFSKKGDQASGEVTQLGGTGLVVTALVERNLKPVGVLVNDYI